MFVVFYWWIGSTFNIFQLVVILLKCTIVNGLHRCYLTNHWPRVASFLVCRKQTFISLLNWCRILVCRLPKDPGGCRAAIPKWFYDVETKSCETFNFGGCEGNGNNFETEQECQDKCNSTGNRSSSKSEGIESRLDLLQIERWKIVWKTLGKILTQKHYYNKESCQKLSFKMMYELRLFKL